MNNKGFAITGILYTLFALFTMILISILAASSFKKNTLSKTVSSLENSFELKKLENITTSYNESRETTKIGKYVFELKYQQNATSKSLICTLYTNKTVTISQKIGESDNPEFVLIPNDCNKYLNFPIYLDTIPDPTITEYLLLTEVYERT